MRTLGSYILVVVVLMCGISALAQTAPSIENGFKSFGSYQSGDIDTVNLQTGNLAFHVPLLSYPQRGAKLTSNLMLMGGSKNWQVGEWTDRQHNLHQKWMLAQSAGVAIVDPTWFEVHRSRHLTTDLSGNQTYTMDDYAIGTGDGSWHWLIGFTPSNNMMTTDGSGIQLVLTSGTRTDHSDDSATVIFRDGTRYAFSNISVPMPAQGQGNNVGGKFFPPELVLDAWGTTQTAYDVALNISTVAIDGNGNVLAPNFDTLGRGPGSITQTSDYSQCATTARSITSAEIRNYPGPDGRSFSLTVCYTTFTPSAAFSQPNVDPPSAAATVEQIDSFAHGIGSYISSILMPDGNRWSFDYDDFGNVTRIGLPTGGSIVYQWTEVPNNEVDDSATQVSRAVSTRTVNDNNGHSYPWTYTWGSLQTDGSITNYVLDPNHNETAHVFQSVLNNKTSFYETETRIYQGDHTHGTLLKTVDTTYQASLGVTNSMPWGFAVNVVPLTITTTLANGLVSQIVRQHDTGNTTMTTYGKVTDEKVYDYGNGAPGALLRETATTYKWQNNSAYLDAGLLDLPATVIVKDGAGCALSEIDYAYDESAYLTSYTGTLPNGTHGNAPGGTIRGDLTTVTRWLAPTSSCNPSGGTPVRTHTNWYDTGEAKQQIDALGNATTHSYDPAYAGAYPTQTCSPASNGINHCVSGTYDLNTGLLESFTDENAATQASGNTPGDAAHTSNFTYDTSWRLISAQGPPDPANNNASATTTFTPSAPNVFPLSVLHTRSLTTALTDQSTTYFDGLGRVYNTQHALPNGTAKVDIQYDGLDQVTSVSNPYFSTSDPTYGAIQTQYDALGRPTQITKQDGSFTVTQYDQTSANSTNGNCITSADEAGHSRKACSDGLGRLIEVDEPQASSVGTNATASVTISGSLQTAPISGSSIPLPATGSSMVGFQEANGTPHAFYLSTNQHILHLFQSSSGGWQAYDVTANSISGNTTNHQPASGTPLTGLANPGGHANSFYFLDAHQHIHETYDHNDNVWYDNDLMTLFGLGAAAPGTALVIYSGSGSIDMHLHYVGADQHIHDLYHNNTTGWADMDVTANSINGNTTNHQPGSGTALTGLLNPGGAVVSFYFLDANQHIHETYCHNDEVWHDNDFMTLFGLGAAAPGTPLTVYAGSGSIDMHLHYLGTDQHIHDLYHKSTTGWAGYDVTADATLWQGISDQPASPTSLPGLLNTGGAAESVYFLDPNQHLHESYAHNDETWTDVDYVATFGASLAASGSTVISYATPTPMDLHVHYLGPNQHLFDMYHNSSTGWSEQDLNTVAQMAVPDSGTISLTVGGFTATACFGSSSNPACSGQPINNNASQVATALAQQLSSFSSPVTATVSGSAISMTWTTPGPINPPISALSSTHDNPGLFPNPSFTNPATNFNGGTAGTLSNPYVTLYSYDTLGDLLTVNQKGDGSQSARVRTFTYDSLLRLLTATNPESGQVAYAYDADGNVLQKTSPAPNQTGAATQTISYCYDALNRVTGKAYSAQACPLSSPVVSYSYDRGTNGIGHLTSLTDQAGSGSYSYDVLGRVVSESRTIAGIQKSLAYAYNLDSSVATLTYPSGAVLTYTPDSAGRILSAVDGGNNINYVKSAAYNATNALTGFVSGNSSSFGGITNSFSYNNRLQPVTMSAASPNATVFSIGYDFHLGNGDNGNVYGITNYRDTSRNQSFTYDALNRLTSAQNAGTDCTQHTANGLTEYWGNSYGYDAWGNLLQKNVTKCSAEHLSVAASVSNQMHTVSGPDYLYDAAGNMTHDATTGSNYSFDQENRIAGAAGYIYTYDADGNRVEKSNGSTGTIYWYMTPGIVAESDLTGTLKSEYVFFDGERVARRDFPGGAASYYFSDHLKTASVITDSAGTIKEDEDYYPWGGELQFVNNDSNHYKFTGKERDSETQLDYFGARYYSNAFGRFVTPDWAGHPTEVPYANFGNPQSLNLYRYAQNNPTTFGDPDGHDPRYWGLGFEKLGEGIANFAKRFGQAAADLGSDIYNFAYEGVKQSNAIHQQLCGCNSTNNYQNQSSESENNSYQQNTEQGRDAQGKFLPKNAGEAAPGAAAEKEALDAVGATKNTERIPGSNRIPDGKIENAGKIAQYVEGKSGASVSNTAQLRQMAKAAKDATGKPLKLVTTNPNVKISNKVVGNENIEIVRLNQK